MRQTPSTFPLSLSLDSEVRDVMTHGVVSIPGDASLRDAHEALVAHEVHALLVTDRHTAAPLGWITARGLLLSAARRTTAHTAKQAITEPVHTISPSASLAKAMGLLLDTNVSHLLVSPRESAMPEGVVSEIDLVRIGGRS
jgi:CBS-domain-containing membrane protein